MTLTISIFYDVLPCSLVEVVPAVLPSTLPTSYKTVWHYTSEEIMAVGTSSISDIYSKWFLSTFWSYIGGVEVQFHSFLNSAPGESEGLTSHSICCIPGKKLHWLQSQYGCSEEKGNVLSLQGFNPWTVNIHTYIHTHTHTHTHTYIHTHTYTHTHTHIWR